MKTPRSFRRDARSRWITAAVVAVGTLVVIAMLLFADASVHAAPTRRAARTVWDSVYSPAQAVRGESSYVATCARCHKASLAGADESPPLAGSAFLANWNGLSLYELHDRVRNTMPTDDPGIYKPDLVTDVLSYMLKVNGFPAGAAELSSSADTLKAIVIRVEKP